MIGVCDGIVMGHSGMRHSLPSREMIADSIELMVRAHRFDAVVMVTNCDKIDPACLMAAARLDLPAVILSGGAMLPNQHRGRTIDLNSAFEAAGKLAKGQMDDAEALEVENCACPTAGSCAGLFTANSMNCMIEALGMGLPFNGTIPAPYSERRRLARAAGRAVMTLLAKGLTARKMMTRQAFLNAIAWTWPSAAPPTPSCTSWPRPAPPRWSSAWTTSTASAARPQPLPPEPRGRAPHRGPPLAGGIPAVMNRLAEKGLLDLSCLAADGRTLAEAIQGITCGTTG